MKKEDRKYLLIFFLLCLAIISVLLYSYRQERRLKVDRKIEYIFDNLTYDDVFKRGEILFKNTLDILNVQNYDYEKDDNNNVKLYTIRGINDYQKINNFDLIFQTFNANDIAKFMQNYGIIYEEKNYYIKNSNISYNPEYIGSKIAILNYDKNYVQFTSTNYYCHNGKYLGLINKEPTCDYNYQITNFKLELSNNTLKINNYEDILDIIK